MSGGYDPNQNPYQQPQGNTPRPFAVAICQLTKGARISSEDRQHQILITVFVHDALSSRMLGCG